LEPPTPFLAGVAVVMMLAGVVLVIAGEHFLHRSKAERDISDVATFGVCGACVGMLVAGLTTSQYGIRRIAFAAVALLFVWFKLLAARSR
jgi:cytochrome c biogenesis protein CcdA